MDYTRVPSKMNAIYSIGIATASGRNLLVDAVVLDFKLTETAHEWAQKVTLNLKNSVADGLLLSEQLYALDRVYIYANDGEECREVFRGFIWKKDYLNKKKTVISLDIYDNLIYFKKSDYCKYFSAGKTTQEVISAICADWGVDLRYNYESITHKKLPLSGKLADIIEDQLNKVKKQTGIKYVVRSAEDIIYIDRYGANAISTVPEIKRRENAISTRSKVSMEDVITKIVFIGKADDNGEVPITDTLEGDTARWGTIQKIIRDDTDNKQNDKNKDLDKLYENAHDEGQYILDEYGKPKDTFEVEAVNNPWLRKGHLVKVGAGDMAFRYIVTSIVHNPVKKTMSLDLELADESKLPSSDNDSTNTVESSNSDVGRAVDLDRAPIYISSDASTPATYLSGTYYIYDGKEILGRYRICGSKDEVRKKPVDEYVTGWLSNEYI